MLLAGAAMFGAGCAVAALMPNYLLFGAVLFVIGVAAQTFTTSTNSLVQTSTEPAMRGRVIAILLAIGFGRHADRRADRRLDRRHFRPALGARRRRDCSGLLAAAAASGFDTGSAVVGSEEHGCADAISSGRPMRLRHAPV